MASLRNLETSDIGATGKSLMGADLDTKAPTEDGGRGTGPAGAGRLPAGQGARDQRLGRVPRQVGPPHVMEAGRGGVPQADSGSMARSPKKFGVRKGRTVRLFAGYRPSMPPNIYGLCAHNMPRMSHRTGSPAAVRSVSLEVRRTPCSNSLWVASNSGRDHRGAADTCLPEQPLLHKRAICFQPGDPLEETILLSGRIIRAMVENKPAPLSRNSMVMSGAVVFSGTRVPVTALFDYLDSEGALAEFLHDFPTVSREQARETLRLARQALSRHSDEDPTG